MEVFACFLKIVLNTVIIKENINNAGRKTTNLGQPTNNVINVAINTSSSANESSRAFFISLKIIKTKIVEPNDHRSFNKRCVHTYSKK